MQGHSRASPAHSGSVLGACCDHPRRAVGAPGGSPRSLKVARERQNGRPGLSRSVPGPLNLTKIDAKFRPGAKKTRLFRATSSKFILKFAAMFQRFLSVLGFFVECLNLQKYCTSRQKQGFGPFTIQVESLAQRRFKKQQTSKQKAIQNRRKSCLGLLGHPCWWIFAARSAPGQRLELGKLQKMLNWRLRDVPRDANNTSKGPRASLTKRQNVYFLRPRAAQSILDTKKLSILDTKILRI